MSEIPEIPKAKWSHSRSGDIIDAFLASDDATQMLPDEAYGDRTVRQVYSALREYVRHRGLPVTVYMRGEDIYLSKGQ